MDHIVESDLLLNSGPDRDPSVMLLHLPTTYVTAADGHGFFGSFPARLQSPHRRPSMWLWKKRHRQAGRTNTIRRGTSFAQFNNSLGSRNRCNGGVLRA